MQEAWLRWQGTDRTQVRNPGAFLATTTTRLGLNVAQSARARRESYVGPWLPEPVDTSADPAVGAEQGQEVELARAAAARAADADRARGVRPAGVLRLPLPRDRRDPGLSPANVRQLVSRARKHLAGERREPVAPGAHRRLLEAFVRAAQTGDVVALERLLADDVVSLSDGNGARGVARVPVVGRDEGGPVRRRLPPRFWPGTQNVWVEANGHAALLIKVDGAPLALLSVTAARRRRSPSCSGR